MQQFPNGFPLTLCILVDEPTKEFNLPASATKTSISDLSPDVDYAVTITAYAGSAESLPISGQITSESSCPSVCVCVFMRKLAPDSRPNASKNLSAAGQFWQEDTSTCSSLKTKLDDRTAEGLIQRERVDKIIRTPGSEMPFNKKNTTSDMSLNTDI